MSKLETWMREHAWTDDAMAEAIGVASRQSVYRYRKLRDVPRRDVMQRIIEVTGGAVQPADFYAKTPHSRAG